MNIYWESYNDWYNCFLNLFQSSSFDYWSSSMYLKNIYSCLWDFKIFIAPTVNVHIEWIRKSVYFFLVKLVYLKINKKSKWINVLKNIYINLNHDFYSDPFIIISLYMYILVSVSKSCYSSLSQYDAQVAN